ncbi:hypothetical protein Gorai_024458 [Gossypium raimondii]|uniref:DUF4283 domain-containing protein n=1 Tax=Gossypium raimondii TaxID=29730 RepID=A0A7J8NZ81_GOSRA|nr:hypothetical protein [Gossypium raimondii]
MAVDSTPMQVESWKDKLLRRGNHGSTGEEDLELLEGDVTKTTINGVPTTNFSKRIQQILIRDMATTSKDDYEKALTQGPWTVFGQYLTVQPWSPDFNPLQPFPNHVMAWVRFPTLPGVFYKRKILEEIGSLIGKVTKLDFKTDCGSRGRFACTAVFINLNKPLIPHVLINGMVQRVEYELLLAVCFLCGRYSHVRDLFPSKETVMDGEMAKEAVIVDLPEKEKMKESPESFGPWMFVERKSRKNSRGNENLTTKILPKQGMGF